MRTVWKSCLDSLTAKPVKPDKNMIASLIKTSENKLLSEERLEMNSITAVSKLSLAYDALRELLEALALKNGYKIYNHECYTAFLKEIMNQSGKGDEFDDIRKVRNAVNYYGKDISPQEAAKIIKNTRRLATFVKSQLNRI